MKETVGRQWPQVKKLRLPLWYSVTEMERYKCSQKTFCASDILYNVAVASGWQSVKKETLQQGENSAYRTFWWKRCSGTVALISSWGKWKRLMWPRINDMTQFAGWGKGVYHNLTVWMPLHAMSKTHHVIRFPSKHSLARVWRRQCYQLHRLTHFTLSPRALHSRSCATAAASAAWQRDIFTMRRLSYVEQGACVCSEGKPPLPTQMCHLLDKRVHSQTHVCTRQTACSSCYGGKQHDSSVCGLVQWPNNWWVSCEIKDTYVITDWRQ